MLTAQNTQYVKLVTLKCSERPENIGFSLNVIVSYMLFIDIMAHQFISK